MKNLTEFRCRALLVKIVQIVFLMLSSVMTQNVARQYEMEGFINKVFPRNFCCVVTFITHDIWNLMRPRSIMDETADSIYHYVPLDE